jgi:pimeloyl-ACP methyl ester carboxylesterase
MSGPRPAPPAFRTISISDPRLEVEDLREITVKSQALGGRADITVHAPAAARKGRGRPLVILLHGVYGSHWAWVRQAGAHRLAARLQAAGDVPPCIVAMPSDGLWGDGSGYLRHHAQDFERWIVEEVPAAVAHAIPSVTPDSPQMIAGLSMGGFGALRIAAEYPQRFLAASGHSAITDSAQMRDFIEEYLDDAVPPGGGRTVLEALRLRQGRCAARSQPRPARPADRSRHRARLRGIPRRTHVGVLVDTYRAIVPVLRGSARSITQ